MSDSQDLIAPRKPRINQLDVEKTLIWAVDALLKRFEAVAQIAESLDDESQSRRFIKASLMLGASRLVHSQPDPSLDRVAVLTEQALKLIDRDQPLPSRLGPSIANSGSFLKLLAARKS